MKGRKQEGVDGPRVTEEADAKLGRLESILEPLRKTLLAFSGGVDSTFLLATLRKDPDRKLLAVTALSPAFPDRDRNEARQLAAGLGVELREIDVRETQMEAFAGNRPDRCYRCKRALFETFDRLRGREGLEVVLDGSNVDDLSDYRPGMRALEELGVRSPLVEAGLTKDEIRQLSRRMDLPTWDKRSLACLASRFPYGASITDDSLARVGRCEEHLARIVPGSVRVRVHGEVARIEVEPPSFRDLLDRREEIVTRFKEQGFLYVTLDLQGYRTGSLNEGL